MKNKLSTPNEKAVNFFLYLVRILPTESLRPAKAV